MEYKLRIIVLGDFGTGKTSFLRRACNEDHNYSYISTIGVDYFNKRFNHLELFKNSEEFQQEIINDTFIEDKRNELVLKSINVRKPDLNFTRPDLKKYGKILKSAKKEDINYHLRIWDTSGQERFSKLINAYYKNLSGAILVFDITNYESFKSIELWHSNLLSKVDENCRGYFPLILVGSKLDMANDREVPYNEATQMAETLGCVYVECSAKSCVNITKIFSELVDNILNKVNNEIIVPQTNNGIFISNKGITILFDEDETLKRKGNSRTLDDERTNRCCVIN